MTDHLHQLAKQAKEAARQLALYDTEQKNRALLAIAQALDPRHPGGQCPGCGIGPGKRRASHHDRPAAAG